MKANLCTIILLGCLVFFAMAEEESNIVTLGSQDIFETLQQGNWFINFFLPGCSFCTILEPEFEKLGNALVDYEGIKAAKFNGNFHHGVLRTFGVTGFPSLFLVKEGKMYQYPPQAERTTDHFLEFIRSGYLNEPEMIIPKGLPVWEPILQFSEDIINETIGIFETNVVSFALVIVGSFALAAIITAVTFPPVLGYGPFTKVHVIEVPPAQEKTQRKEVVEEKEDEVEGGKVEKKKRKAKKAE